MFFLKSLSAVRISGQLTKGEQWKQLESGAKI